MTLLKSECSATTASGGIAKTINARVYYVKSNLLGTSPSRFTDLVDKGSRANTAASTRSIIVVAIATRADTGETRGRNHVS